MRSEELMETISSSSERLGGPRGGKIGKWTYDGVGEIDAAFEDLSSATLRDFVDMLQPYFLEGSLKEMHFTLSSQDFGERFYLDFYPSGSVEAELVIDNGIPYSLQDVRAVIEASMVPISGAIDGFSMRGDHLPSKDAHGAYWLIKIGINDFDIRIRDLHKCHSELIGRLGVSRGRASVDRYTEVLRKVRDGRWDSLIGEHETSWLEFKSNVDLKSEKGRVELAQDISRFANSERSGLLLVGFRTERRQGSDIVTKLTPLIRSEHTVRRYEDVIDARVYPPIRGLSVERSDLGGEHCVILINIPAQREDEKPFIVHGAIVDGKVEGVFFSVVRRRGEGSIPMTVRELHSLISAGRQALRSRPVRNVQ